MPVSYSCLKGHEEKHWRAAEHHDRAMAMAKLGMVEDDKGDDAAYEWSEAKAKSGNIKKAAAVRALLACSNRELYSAAASELNRGNKRRAAAILTFGICTELGELAGNLYYFSDYSDDDDEDYRTGNDHDVFALAEAETMRNNKRKAEVVLAFATHQASEAQEDILSSCGCARCDQFKESYRVRRRVQESFSKMPKGAVKFNPNKNWT